MSRTDDHERITLRIPKRVHDAAVAAAKSEHVSLNSFIVRLLAKYAPKLSKKPAGDAS